MDGGGAAPSRIVWASAPIRICDNGGWTDTWFAGHGRVFNIAVTPRVAVRICLYKESGDRERVTIKLEDEDDPRAPGALGRAGRHPLLETTLDEIGLPAGFAAEISVSSGIPPGSSTGTSASASVALIAALDALTPSRMTAERIAAAAHHVEVGRLGLQSGVQDQLCAAHGGVNYIEVSPYPEATVTQIPLTDGLRRELEERILLVCLGRPHVSSDIHDRVIAALSGDGSRSPLLEGLRGAADDARDAMLAGDLQALGRALTSNTELQRRLHPDLVSREAQAVIDAATALGAAGWKVNGAGGDGGSVTILSGPKPGAKARLAQSIVEADPLFRVVPTTLSRDGVRVWEE